MSASTTRPALACVLAALAAGCAGSPYAHDAREWGDAAVGGAPVVGSRDLGRAIEFAPVAVDSGWLVGVTNRRVVLLAGDTVQEVWTGKLSGSPAGTPVVVGDLVVQGTDSPGFEIYGLSLADGSVRWRREAPAARVAAGDGALFAVDLAGGVACLDTASGEPVWETRLDGAGWTAPVVAAGLLLVPQRPDSVTALSVADGERVWSRAVEPWPQLAAADSTVYVLGENGTLEAVRGATGETVLSRALAGYPAGPAVPWGDRVVVSLTDGRVLQLDARTLATRAESRLDPPLVAAPAVGRDRIAQPAPRGWIVLLDARGGEAGRLRHPERLGTAPVFFGDLVGVGGGGGTFIVYRSGS